MEREATKWWIKCSAVKSGGSEAAAVEGSRRESHTLLLGRCDDVRKKSCYSPAKKLLASLGSLLIADNLQKQPDDDLSAL